MNSLKRKEIYIYHHCGFSFIVDFPSTSLQQVLKDQSNPIWSTRWCDISHPLSVYCLGVVLYAIFPQTPSSADQQYVTLWPTNTICNILRCIMQYSGQQYTIFWPTTITCNFAHWIFPLFLFSSTMPIGQICMSLWKSNTADLLN